MLPESIFGLHMRDEGAYDFPGLPLLFRSSYEGRLARIGDVPCVIATPRGQLRPLQAERLCQSVLERESLPCLIHAKGATAYQRKAMTERGVAWIFSENTFSIPFLAASSSARELRRKSARPLSANAQRVAVGAIGGLLMGMTTSELAKTLGMSLSSAGNYLAELDAACHGLVDSRGRTRFLRVPDGMTREGLYDALRPYMSSPVRERTYLKVAQSDADAIGSLPLSGMSALSMCTMIADDPWRTLALFGDSVDEMFPGSVIVGEHDQPDALMEVWRYAPWQQNGMVDAVSLLLGLEEWGETGDERLEDAIAALRREALS